MTAPAWWEKLPPRDHPLWKIAQTVVALGGIALMVAHGSVHVEDAAGVGGAGVIGWLIRGFLGKES